MGKKDSRKSKTRLRAAITHSQFSPVRQRTLIASSPSIFILTCTTWVDTIALCVNGVLLRLRASLPPLEFPPLQPVKFPRRNSGVTIRRTEIRGSCGRGPQIASSICRRAIKAILDDPTIQGPDAPPIAPLHDVLETKGGYRLWSTCHNAYLIHIQCLSLKMGTRSGKK